MTASRVHCPPCSSGVLTALVGLFCAATLACGQEPEPLRRADVVEGRTFQYNAESFLHRFTYRLRPADVWSWALNPTGYRGTLGSTRSEEFFSDQALYQQLALTDRVYFDFRWRQAEDFDGTYDRTLLGMSVRLGESWWATVRADLEADKQNVDAHLELAWGGAEGRRLRLALVLVDPTINTKSDDEQRYRVFPYTAFAEFLWRFPGDVQVQVWANMSPHAQLELERRDFDFIYDQYAVGMRAQVPVAERWWCEFDAHGETGERDRRPLLVASDDTVRTLTRRQWDANLELHHRLTDGVTPWVGYHRFFFDERDRRPFDPLEDADRVRRENLVHLGVSCRLNDRCTFWPGLYVDFLNSRERFDGDFQKDQGWRGKLALPIDLRFLRHAAVLTLNPTLRVDQLRFGGANVQLRMVF